MTSGLVCAVWVSLYFGASHVPYRGWLPRFLWEIELKTVDLRFRFRDVREANPAIVIVAFDQKSQDALGPWPLSRDIFAAALNRLTAGGARVVVFDIFFPRPDRFSGPRPASRKEGTQSTSAISRAENPGCDDVKETLPTDTENDLKFARALSCSKNAILGYYFYFSPREGNAEDEERRKMFVHYLSARAPFTEIVHPEYQRRFDSDARGILPDLPRLAEYAKGFGFCNAVGDSDGVMRRQPLVVRYHGNYYSSLALAAAQAYASPSHHGLGIVFNPQGAEAIKLQGVPIKTSSEGSVQVDFLGPAGTYPTYSLVDVLDGKIPVRVFGDKLVLVGATAPEIKDTVAVPFQPGGFPGVELHANVVDNLLAGRFISRGPREFLIDIGLILLLGFAPAVLAVFMSPARASVLVLTLFLAFSWIAYFLFAHRQEWISVVFPCHALGFAYLAIAVQAFMGGGAAKSGAQS